MQSCPTCQSSLEDGATTCPFDGTPLAPAPHPWIGRVLGERYRILAKLGEGGMGTVFLAEHVVLGKQMAVKVLREDFSRDEELVKRFQQEAISASRIGHENIVDITDFGRAPEGALYFVMELLAGASLAKVIATEGALQPARSLPILTQICRALGAAHARGIVHRDLKPDNVMVLPRDGGRELVKVLDFGISKVQAKGGEKLTRVGMLMGTPEYMAPEQVDAGNADHRVDIYAMGALAYEVVTGSVPFSASSPVKLLMKHQTEPVEPPSRRRPDLVIPQRLEATILRALAKQPQDRHASMNELAAELSACAAELGVAPLTPSTMAPVAAAGVIKLVTPTPVTPPVGAASRGGTMQLSHDELVKHTPRGGTAVLPLPSGEGQGEGAFAATRPATPPASAGVVSARASTSPPPGGAGAIRGTPPSASNVAPTFTGPGTYGAAGSLTPGAASAASPTIAEGAAHAMPAAAAASAPTLTNDGLSAAVGSPTLAIPGTDASASASRPTRNTLAPEERAAVKRGSGAVIGFLVAVILMLGGGVVWLVLNRIEAAKNAVEAPTPITEGVDAPNALSLGGGKKKPAPEATDVAPPTPTPPTPPAPEVVPAAAVIHHVQVTSKPKGAAVWLGDNIVGATPLTLDLKDGEVNTYKFTFMNHVPKEQAIAATDSDVVVKLEKEKRQRGQKDKPASDNPYEKIDDLKANPFH